MWYNLSCMAEFEQGVTNTQQQVDMALGQINKTRRLREDYTEFTLDPEYASARQELLRSLNSIPESIHCLTIDVVIPPCPQQPTTEIDYLNRNLRRLVTPLTDSASDFTTAVSVRFVIKPPQMPEELKGISFGSRARDLSEQVVETITVGEKGNISLIEINPLGEPKTSASRNNKALIFPTPLRFVQSITLETEEKSLTPYLERNNEGFLVVHRLNYS